jgi:hypothetical protein
MLRTNFLCVFHIVFLACQTLQSQSGLLQGGGANLVGLARVSSVLAGVESLYGNVAGIVSAPGRMGFDVSMERRFGLSELNTISAAGYYSFSNSKLGFRIVNFGFEEYREQKLGLCYGMKLTDKLDIGAGFNAMRYFAGIYGSTGIVSFDLGMLAEISSRVKIGAHINNPLSVSVTENSNLPAAISLGTAWQAGKKIVVYTELEKLIDRNLALKFAFAYRMHEYFEINLGLDLSREILGFGFRYSFGDFTTSGAFSLNNVLGNTPAFSLQYIAN